MSLTLALDTATDLATVAVGEGGVLIAEVAVGPRRHAGAVLPGIAEVLRLAGAELADVSRILLADGPGSFTGLRIGAATMQGLRRARPGIAVAVTPSLLSAAWTGAQLAEGPVAALYDALRGQVFAGVYRFVGARVEVVAPPTLTTVEALARDCPAAPALAVGDGAAAHADAIRSWTGRAPVAPPAGAPRAASLLVLAGLAGALRPVDEPAAFEPDYGRPAEAQARWERVHGRALPDSRGRSR